MKTESLSKHYFNMRGIFTFSKILLHSSKIDNQNLSYTPTALQQSYQSYKL